jgi:hypothetical protein
VVASGLVVVEQDGDEPSLECGRVAVAPLAGAHGVAGGDQAEVAEAVDVLLALDDEDDLGGIGREQLGQAVEDGLDAVEAPDPSALAAGSALDEALGLVAHDLEEEGAVGVAIVIGGHDPAAGRLAPALGLGLGGLGIGRSVFLAAGARALEPVGIGL